LRKLGATLLDIRRYASEQEPPWNVSDRQLQRYMRSAEKLSRKLARGVLRSRFARHLLQRQELLARAVAQEDVKTALAVLKDEAELLNLYPPKRVEASGPNGGPIPTAIVELKPDERDAAIRAIVGRTPALGSAGHRPPVDREGDGDGSALGEAGTPD